MAKRRKPAAAIAALRPAAMVAGLITLSACEPAAPPPQDNGTAGAEPSAPPEESGNAAMENEGAGTSIMRPEVVATPEPEPIQPETLVLPFGFNGNDLDDAARAALDNLLETPAFATGGPIIVRGHTDSRGFDVDNARVSRKRADAVRAYLVEKGVAEERITAIGLGETRPVAPNANLDGSDNPEGRERNRRVEVEVAVGEELAATE